MALSINNARDLALKLRFEASLARSMRSLFEDMTKDMAAYYKNAQQVLDTSKYNVEINGLLRRHYRKVSAAFEDRLREDIGKKTGWYETKALADKVKQLATEYIYRRSIEQTHFISRTNTEESFNAFQTVIVDAAINGDKLSAEKIAKLATEKFEGRALGRARTIGQTETQNIAEKTKDLEAIALSEEDIIVGGVVLRPENITKTWSTILDDHTRPAHVLADDQTVAQDQPFFVMQQKLMFPGDDSLEATAENIINCRCNTNRAVELAELPDFVIHPENQAPRFGTLFMP